MAYIHNKILFYYKECDCVIFTLSKIRQIQKDKYFLLYVESIFEHDMNI